MPNSTRQQYIHIHSFSFFLFGSWVSIMCPVGETMEMAGGLAKKLSKPRSSSKCSERDWNYTWKYTLKDGQTRPCITHLWGGPGDDHTREGSGLTYRASDNLPIFSSGKAKCKKSTKHVYWLYSHHTMCMYIHTLFAPHYVERCIIFQYS